MLSDIVHCACTESSLSLNLWSEHPASSKVWTPLSTNDMTTIYMISATHPLRVSGTNLFMPIRSRCLCVLKYFLILLLWFPTEIRVCVLYLIKMAALSRGDAVISYNIPLQVTRHSRQSNAERILLYCIATATTNAFECTFSEHFPQLICHTTLGVSARTILYCANQFTQQTVNNDRNIHWFATALMYHIDIVVLHSMKVCFALFFLFIEICCVNYGVSHSLAWNGSIKSSKYCDVFDRIGEFVVIGLVVGFIDLNSIELIAWDMTEIFVEAKMKSRSELCGSAYALRQRIRNKLQCNWNLPFIYPSE